jgi:hypothetical protein
MRHSVMTALLACSCCLGACTTTADDVAGRDVANTGTPQAANVGGRSVEACTSTLAAVAGGAVGGAAAGGGVGALAGAVAGGVIGGVAGAVWADQNNDGCVDGYTVGGLYHPGAPKPEDYQPASVKRGERG